MNSLSQPLFCVLCKSLSSPWRRWRSGLSLVAAGRLGRGRRGSGSLAVVGLTAMALSPWPSWRSNWDHVFRGHAGTSGVVRDGAATSTSALRGATVRHAVNGDISDLPDSDPIGMAPESERSSTSVGRGGRSRTLGIGRALSRRPDRDGGPDRVRVAAVRGYRRDSLPLSDRRLLELVDVVRAELGCKRPIHVRTGTRSSTPATVGWRQPVLLLPVNWRTWTDEECLAVLAHEIEHVPPAISRRGSSLNSDWPCIFIIRWSTGWRPACGSSKSWRPTRPPVSSAGSAICDDARRDGVTAIGRGRSVHRPRTFYRIKDVSSGVEMLHRSRVAAGGRFTPSFISASRPWRRSLCAGRPSRIGGGRRVDKDGAAPSAVPSRACGAGRIFRRRNWL